MREEQNPYKSPEAPLAEPPKVPLAEPASGDIFTDLRSESTWWLWFLFVFTYGVYGAHYVKRQTAVLNAHLRPPRQVSAGLVNTVLGLAYLSLALWPANFLLPEAPLPFRTTSLSGPATAVA